MTIVLVRVDERLIHGQILEGWLPSTKAQELLIANDELAQDLIQKEILLSAVPYSVNVVIDSVDRVASMLIAENEREVRRMVLVDNPQDALRLKRAGVDFDNLNLGNLTAGQAAACLSRSVAVGDDSLQALLNILEEGVSVSIQSVPFEKPVDFCDVCGCASKHT
ncbi:MAG: PTS sugar transporter subunit IIB [Desulfomonile tiedjei]|uniref:PTS sugar transporter subunit IIB n=1 Tax=Desulfomonile tiedjei TaxID=2358 RepID=A0A9D6V5X4_9BACT|nr:PTS sugar transporter subunit IIB [Desulfomonile tiedjei]